MEMLPPKSSDSAANSDLRSAFRPATGEIPTAPGVYRFSDRSGRVMYIGKAKNLRARLANYFAPLSTLSPKTARMMMLSTSVDWTVVETDTEALVLERSLIREHKPPFNIQFRDDKSYPYIAVTLGDDAPRLLITRRRNIRGAKYFGPFPKLWAVRETVALLNRAFPIRTCNDQTFKRALSTQSPCFASQIGRCSGPCSLNISAEEHRTRVDRLVAFLAGNDQEQLRELRADMASAAAKQEYEIAARLRDQIAAAEHVLERNTVALRDSVNADVFGLVVDDLGAAVHQFIVRSGRIRGERSWLIERDSDTGAAELMSNVLKSAYDEADLKKSRSSLLKSGSGAIELPGEILVSDLPDDAAALAEVLSLVRGEKIRIHRPERGEKQQITQRAVANAQENLQRNKLKRASDIVSRTDALAELQRAFNMDEPPLHIECIDISHLSGSDIVGSLVVFDDALPAKSGYRHYKIAESTDDTDSMFQVVSRRFISLAAKRDEAARDGSRIAWPQLLLVDGGLPQVNAAHRALEELGITDVTVRGIAKRLEEIWAPDADFPTILPRSSEALYLLQRVRDEAHRFAITFQRKQRGMSVVSELANIAGLGEKRVQNLLRTFKSVKRIRVATADELSSVGGISPVLAERIVEYFAAQR